jgi:hypothetical protein
MSMRITWTRFEDARPIDLYASVCFVFLLGAGLGLIVELLMSPAWWGVPWFAALYLLHRRLERKATRPYVIAAARVTEAWADDGAPLTPEDEEMLPPDPCRWTS